jgi:hypothetical protein
VTRSANGKVRWTPSLLRAFFEAVVQRFGPYHDWKTRRPDGLDTFCENFALTFGASNGAAVRLKIEDAARNPANARGPIVGEYARIKTAAVEVGFLSRAEAWPSEEKKTGRTDNSSRT